MIETMMAVALWCSVPGTTIPKAQVQQCRRNLDACLDKVGADQEAQRQCFLDQDLVRTGMRFPHTDQ